MNRRVLPASCRQRKLGEAPPTRRRQHLGGARLLHWWPALFASSAVAFTHRLRLAARQLFGNFRVVQ